MLRHVSKLFRLRYSVRRLLILVTLVCVLFGWFAVRMHRAERQAAAVRVLGADHVEVVYDYMLDNDGRPTGRVRAPSGVLRRYLGRDFFSKVVRVEFPAGQLPQCGLSPLQGLHRVRHLSLRGSRVRDRDIPIDVLTELRSIDAAFTNITDSTVNRLVALDNLESLDLSGTLITDASLQHLGKSSALKELKLQDVVISEHSVKQLKDDHPSLTVVWSNAPSRNHLTAMRQLAQHGAAIHFVSKDQATTAIDSYLSPGYRVVINGDRSNPRNGIESQLAAMEHMEGLSTLELNDLSLTSTEWQMLSKLHTLRSVTFSNVDMSMWGRFPQFKWDQLVHLSLRGWTIQYHDRIYIAELPVLESLTLRDTRASDNVLPALEQLQNLRQIDLSRTYITDNGMATLGRLEKLETIELCSTRISDRGLAELERLKSLRSLGLGMTEISDSGLTTLASIETIENLDLSFTGITDAGLAKLRRMPCLSKINLAGAFVSDKGLRYLTEIRSFKELWLIVDGNRITQAGIHELRAAFPHIRITLIGGKP